MIESTKLKPLGVIVVAAGLACGLAIGYAGAVLLALLGIIGVALALVYPEAIVAVALLSGRFNRVPVFDWDWGLPMYVAAPAIAASTVALVLRGRKFQIHAPSLVGAVALTLWVAVSYAWTPARSYGFEKTLEYVMYLLPLFVLGSWAVHDPRGQSRILPWFALLPAILAVIAVASGGSDARISALGGGPNVFGRFMVIGLIAATTLAVRSRSWLRVTWVTALLPLFTGLLLSGSRQAALGFGLIAAAIGLGVVARGLRKFPLRTVVGTVVVVTVVALVAGTVWSRSVLGARLALLAAQDKGASVDVRATWWVQSLEASRQSWLTGYGVGAFAPLFNNTDTRAYPHNILVETALESGIVGVVLLAWLILGPIGRGIRRRWGDGRSLSPEEVALITSYVFAVFVALVSGDMYDNRFVWFFAGALSAYVGEPTGYPRS